MSSPETGHVTVPSKILVDAPPPTANPRRFKDRRSASAQSSAIGAPAYTESLPRLPESASLARRLATHALAVWRLDLLAESAELVVTEFVANAADHARGALIRVTFTRLTPQRVRVAVIDMSRALPTRRVTSLEDIDGRGLALVEALSAKWGTDRFGWGKRVWSELEALEDERNGT